MIRYTLILLAIAWIGLGAIGCNSQPTPFPSFAQMEAALQKSPAHGHESQLCNLPGVIRFISGDAAGSATHLQDGRVVMCLHELTTQESDYYFNGIESDASIETQGSTTSCGDDWVLLRIDQSGENEALSKLDISTDFNRRPVPGEIIYLVGFRIGDSSILDEDFLRQPPQVLPAMVIDPPPLRAAASGEVFVASLVKRVNTRGMSGGPVVMWDPKTQSWIVVGIFTTQGRVRYSTGETLDYLVIAQPQITLR